MSLLKNNSDKMGLKNFSDAEPARTDLQTRVDGSNDDSNHAGIEFDQVDFPVNEDLSEYQTRAQNTEGRIDKIDIDLTDISVDNAVFADSDLLAVNHIKPFSRQINLNLNALAEKGYVIPEKSDIALSNTFRMIKRPILNIAGGKGTVNPSHPNLIMITSSVSGEGKSYTAINLALSLAMERDKHVMLIDADVIKPSHNKIFGIDVPYGLTDLLLAKAKDMSEVICKTNIPSLSVMFTGALYSHVTELLASQAMDNFIADISGRYSDRIIIFDSPPLLMTTESSVLASHMGQVVLVVEAEKTLKHQVDKSLSLLSNDVVMLLLNKMRANADADGYGYYGYEYKSK